MAFSEPVRPVVTPCCIPLVQNRHCPGHKKKFKIIDYRSSVEVHDAHVHPCQCGYEHQSEVKIGLRRRPRSTEADFGRSDMNANVGKVVLST